MYSPYGPIKRPYIYIYIYIKDEIGWVKIKSEIIKNKLESCKLSNTKDNQERRRETMKKEDNFFLRILQALTCSIHMVNILVR